jgi:hypothetical protein
LVTENGEKRCFELQFHMDEQRQCIVIPKVILTEWRGSLVNKFMMTLDVSDSSGENIVLY